MAEFKLFSIILTTRYLNHVHVKVYTEAFRVLALNRRATDCKSKTLSICMKSSEKVFFL